MIFICFISTILMYSHISHITIKFASKKHEIFNEIMQKLWFKIGVRKSMKIFFIRNVPNNIPWSLKVFSGMPVTIFPRKPMKKSFFFLPVCHCGTLYSKSVIPCARPNTALWRTAARQLQSDGFLRLITFRSSASSMFCSW